MNEKVIYFSLNPDRKKSFYNYIRDERVCYTPKFSFTLEGEDMEFRDPRQLIGIIESNEKKESLHIIIDYVSCCGKGEEINYSTAIRDIIMCYPEVQFLFDETFVQKSKDERKEKFSFMNFLFWKAEIVNEEMANVLAEFHQFDMSDEKKIKEQFIRLLKGCNNMYDGSNLRHAIKCFKRNNLSVESNYKNIQASRSTYAAVVAEEEYHQCMFNSYCLYACGFRVIPIVSATELLWMNNAINTQNSFFCKTEKAKDEATGKETEVKVGPLLIRDYDLQFLDEGLTKSGVKIGDVVASENSNEEIKLNEIDCIRGAKRVVGAKEQPGFMLVSKLGKNSSSSIIKLQDDNNKHIDNPYWRAFDDDRIYFVSKGGDGIKLEETLGNPMESAGDSLILRGIEKPLEGVYASLRDDVGFVRDRYDKSRDKHDFVTSRTGSSGHSCPLDIYGIARAMVNRAEEYCKNGCNRLAALVAGEALEVLNGFHKSLMYKAYYVQAVSENAMAMSLLGGDERVLRKDVRFRLNQKVKEDVNRMIPDDEKYKYNLLYNIFNDCMLFCQQKEYFDAADEALSIMVHEKEGMTSSKLKEKLEENAKKIWSLVKIMFGKKSNYNCLL